MTKAEQPRQLRHAALPLLSLVVLVLVLAMALLSLHVLAIWHQMEQLQCRVDELSHQVTPAVVMTVQVSPPVRVTAYEPSEDYDLWQGKDRYDRPLIPGRSIAAKDVSPYAFPDGSVVMLEGIPNLWEVCDTGDGKFDLDICMMNQEQCRKFGVRYKRAAAVTGVRLQTSPKLNSQAVANPPHLAWARSVGRYLRWALGEGRL